MTYMTCMAFDMYIYAVFPLVSVILTLVGIPTIMEIRGLFLIIWHDERIAADNG